MVIPGHNRGNSQVSVNKTIGPTLVFFCTQIEQQEMTAQRLGRKMVHMKNSSKENTSKMSRGGKINIYFCLIIEAKHILMLFE